MRIHIYMHSACVLHFVNIRFCQYMFPPNIIMDPRFKRVVHFCFDPGHLIFVDFLKESHQNGGYAFIQILRLQQPCTPITGGGLCLPVPDPTGGFTIQYHGLYCIMDISPGNFFQVFNFKKFSINQLLGWTRGCQTPNRLEFPPKIMRGPQSNPL